MEDKTKTPTVFICYAREDPDALENFVDLFRDYNYDFDILIDTNPYSGNIHERFKKFARECIVSIILVNARLIDPKSYANVHEIPIIKRRLKDEHVIAVGVLLQDVNPTTWNIDGDFYFFPITYNEIPTARRVDEYRQKHNKQFVVYKNLDDRSRDTFQKELREWILVLIENHKNLCPELEKIETPIIEDKIELRTQLHTNKILTKMIRHQTLEFLERKLSDEKTFWDKANISPPLHEESYTWWYFRWQSLWYKNILFNLKNKDKETFIHERVKFSNELNERNGILIYLFNGHLQNECIIEIKILQNILNNAFKKLSQSKNTELEFLNLLEELCNTINNIIRYLSEISKTAYNIVNKQKLS